MTFQYFKDGQWVDITGDTGVQISATEPTNKAVVWVDTAEPGDAVLPLGGTTGQSLLKVSGDDYDTEWETLVPTGGSAGEVLIKSSATDYDADWQLPLTSLLTLPVVSGGTAVVTIPGAFYLRRAGNNGYATNELNYSPWLIDRPMTLLSFVVAVAQVTPVVGTPAQVRAAVYATDEQWQPYGPPLADSGAIDCDSLGVKTQTLGTPVTLQRGRYTVIHARIQGATNLALNTFGVGLPSVLVTSGNNLEAVGNRRRVNATDWSAFTASPQTDPPNWNSQVAATNLPAFSRIAGEFSV